MQKFLTVGEIAKELQVHVMTVRRLIWDGKLGVVKIGSAIRVPAEEYQKFIKSRGVANQHEAR